MAKRKTPKCRSWRTQGGVPHSRTRQDLVANDRYLEVYTSLNFLALQPLYNDGAPSICDCHCAPGIHEILRLDTRPNYERQLSFKAGGYLFLKLGRLLQSSNGITQPSNHKQPSSQAARSQLVRQSGQLPPVNPTSPSTAVHDARTRTQTQISSMAASPDISDRWLTQSSVASRAREQSGPSWFPHLALLAPFSLLSYLPTPAPWSWLPIRTAIHEGADRANGDDTATANKSTN